MYSRVMDHYIQVCEGFVYFFTETYCRVGFAPIVVPGLKPGYRFNPY